MGKQYVTVDRPADAEPGSGWKGALAQKLANAAGGKGAVVVSIKNDEKCGDDSRVCVQLRGTPSDGQKQILGL